MLLYLNGDKSLLGKIKKGLNKEANDLTIKMFERRVSFHTKYANYASFYVWPPKLVG